MVIRSALALVLILGLMLGARAEEATDRIAAQAATLGLSQADRDALTNRAEKAFVALEPYKTKVLGPGEQLPAPVGQVLDDITALSPRYQLKAEQVLNLMVEFAVGINEVSHAPDPQRMRNAFVPLQKLFQGKETPGADLLKLYGPLLQDGLTQTLALEPERRLAGPPGKSTTEQIRTARKIADFAKKHGLSTTELLRASQALQTGLASAH
ncbi:hypothetical protein DYH09_04315 [bacterium CPR1]|nr:hypothetical protein [bacterium CPR1]